MKNLLLLFIILLGACSNSSPGDNYLGAWQNISRPKDMILIERNGESFIINKHSFGIFDGKYRETEKMPFVLENGILSNSFVKVSHIEATDTLTDGSSEYKRIDRSVFTSVAQDQE